MENKDLIAFMPEEDLAVEGRAVDMNSDSNIKMPTCTWYLKEV